MVQSEPVATSPSDRPRALWAQVEPGFHVGNTSGAFLGSIETAADGRYNAFNAQAQYVGTYEDLIRAKVATEAVSARGDVAPALTYTPDAGFVLATLSGFAAVVATVLGFATIAGG